MPRILGWLGICPPLKIVYPLNYSGGIHIDHPKMDGALYPPLQFIVVCMHHLSFNKHHTGIACNLPTAILLWMPTCLAT